MSAFEDRSVSDQPSSVFDPQAIASSQIEIDTPEQVELHYNIAGIGSRFVAILLDQLFIGAFYLVAVVAMVVIFAGYNGPAADTLDTAGKWVIAGFLFLNFLLLWGYFALFEAFWHGQTPGKRIMKLRVIKDSGRQITLFESLARNLLRFVDYLPGMYLAGVITMLCNKRNKRLGDLAAGTMVIHERLDDQPLLYQSQTTLVAPSTFALQQPWEAPGSNAPWQQATPALFPADAITRLTPQDLIVMEAFFTRMLDLPLETRATLAYRIAAQMAGKMGVNLPGGNPERALESMVFQMRGSGRSV